MLALFCEQPQKLIPMPGPLATIQPLIHSANDGTRTDRIVNGQWRSGVARMWMRAHLEAGERDTISTRTKNLRAGLSCENRTKIIRGFCMKAPPVCPTTPANWWEHMRATNFTKVKIQNGTQVTAAPSPQLLFLATRLAQTSLNAWADCFYAPCSKAKFCLGGPRGTCIKTAGWPLCTHEGTERARIAGAQKRWPGETASLAETISERRWRRFHTQMEKWRLKYIDPEEIAKTR